MSDRTEGDINSTKARKKWQKENPLSKVTKELLKKDENIFFHQSMSTPCLNGVKKAEGIYIYDLDGRSYMDFHGNSVHQLGHAHPAVIEALQNQMNELTFSPRRYTNETSVKLAEKLVGLMDSKESYRVLFTTAGTTSIGLALKMARRYTGKHKTISLWDSFHGASLDAISVGGEAVFRKGMGPLLSGAEHIMPYNSYRCVFGDCSVCGLKCLDYLEYILEREGDVGAVLLETIRSTDVQIPPQSYFKKLRKICDTYGVLLILDEVPTGFGRTGQMYAFQHYGIEPDILVLGKGLGGGIWPLSAVLGKEKLNVCQDISLGHYTHEKSPLGAAAALAMIEWIESNHTIEKVNQLSKVFYKELKNLQKKYPLIGDVRVIGLMGALELVCNLESKEKNNDLAENILYDCLSNGLSFKVSQGNVLTLTPPLIITEEELKSALKILENSFEKLIGPGFTNY